LRRNDVAGAAGDFAIEMSDGVEPHLHARESAAACAYALGAWHLRLGDTNSAQRHFEQALARVSGHPLALAARAGSAEPAERQHLSIALDQRLALLEDAGQMVDVAMARAVRAAAEGDDTSCLERLADVLASAPPGSAGWMAPLDPLLSASESPAWTRVRALVRLRAA
jgi:hypothetical protein